MRPRSNQVDHPEKICMFDAMHIQRRCRRNSIRATLLSLALTLSVSSNALAADNCATLSGSDGYLPHHTPSLHSCSGHLQHGNIWATAYAKAWYSPGCTWAYATLSAYNGTNWAVGWNSGSGANVWWQASIPWYSVVVSGYEIHSGVCRSHTAVTS